MAAFHWRNEPSSEPVTNRFPSWLKLPVHTRLSCGSRGVTGCVAGRAIYEGKLDFAAAVKLAAGES